jgi:hypothetical protein
MRLIVNACLAATCFVLVGGFAQTASAQVGGVAVAFRNELKTPVIVQGFTVVNGMQKRGQAFVIVPGKVGADLGVPAGPRFYTVYDANNPKLVYVLNFQVPVQGNDIALIIGGIPPTNVKIGVPGP